MRTNASGGVKTSRNQTETKPKPNETETDPPLDKTIDRVGRRRSGGIEPLGRQAPKDLKSSPLAREAQLGETFKHGSLYSLGFTITRVGFTGC